MVNPFDTKATNERSAASRREEGMHSGLCGRCMQPCNSRQSDVYFIRRNVVHAVTQQLPQQNCPVWTNIVGILPRKKNGKVNDH